MLTLERVSFGYPDQPLLLNQCSYRFASGQITGITGPSGCGKSTLLYLLAGLLTPLSGVSQNEHRTTAMIFQDARLFPWMTAKENITVVGASSERADQLLNALFQESDVAKKYPHELSGGMQQRISIARALASEPDLLLLDEPFQGLDEQTRAKTVSLILEEMKEKTCLLVSHQGEDLALCHEQVVFDQIRSAP